MGIQLFLMLVAAGLAQAEQSSAGAETTVRITRLDGTQQSADFAGLADDAIVIIKKDKQSRLPLEVIQLVEFSPDRRPDPRPKSTFDLMLNDGGLLFGSIASEQESGIAWQSALVENQSIPFRQIAGIYRSQSTSTFPTSWADFRSALSYRLTGQDVLISQDDHDAKTVRGTLVSVDPDGGRFLFSGRERTFRWDAVFGIVLANPAAERPTPQATVTFNDGQALAGRLTTADDEFLLTNDWLPKPLTLPTNRISTISLFNNRVVYLTDLTPKSQISDGILHTGSSMRRNRNVANETITMQNIEYAKGLGVHALSKLTYQLDGDYATFAATIGIDDLVRPRGSVVFAITGDDRELFRSEQITGNDPPADISIDVIGIDELTLIVEYGDDLDLSDLANWANARVVKPREKQRHRH